MECMSRNKQNPSYSQQISNVLHFFVRMLPYLLLFMAAIGLTGESSADVRRGGTGTKETPSPTNCVGTA